MSGTDLDPVELIAFYDSIFIENCCGFASLSLLVYEYAITIGREVDLFWGRKLTGASVLFHVNRYLPLIYNIVSFIGLAKLSDRFTDVHRCSQLVHAAPILSIFQYVPWAAIAGLRVFALSGRRWSLSILVFLLAAMPFAINCYTYTTLASFNDPIFGCEATRHVPPGLLKKLTITSRTCLMASDVLVIVTTWFATYQTTKFRHKNHLTGLSFASTLLVDGSIYFVVLLHLNALHLAFTLLPATYRSLSSISYVTLFTEPITAILVSRCLLNLQAVNRASIGRDTDSVPTLVSVSASTPLYFERILGSLGSDVRTRIRAGDSSLLEDSLTEAEASLGKLVDDPATECKALSIPMTEMGAGTGDGHLERRRSTEIIPA